MPQISFPPLLPIGRAFLIASGALFLINALLARFESFSLLGLLALTPPLFWQGAIHQAVSFPLVCAGIWEALFNGLLFWFVGSELEGIWGKKRYLFFLLFSTLATTVAYLAMGAFFPTAPLAGPHGLAMGLVLAYGILFPNRYFSFLLIFPIKAKYFSWIILALETYFLLLGGHGIQTAGHLSTAGFGFVAMILMARPPRKKKKRKTHLRLMENDPPPKYWQ